MVWEKMLQATEESEIASSGDFVVAVNVKSTMAILSAYGMPLRAAVPGPHVVSPTTMFHLRLLTSAARISTSQSPHYSAACRQAATLHALVLV
jgi:hypothetical protein